MDNQKTIEAFLNVEAKLKSLLLKYENALQELHNVKQEKARLEAQIEAQKRDLKNFQNQDKISKIASSVTVGEQGKNTELKLKINEYIKEIDKCIAHLKG